MYTTTILQKTIATVAIALVSFYGFSQGERQAKKDKIEQLKIAYITSELDLTTEEAEKFWPAYNDMTDDLRQEKKSRRKKSMELKNNFETLSEADIKKKTLEILDSEIAEAKLKKEHTEKIAEIIGYKKTVKLLSVEKQFKKELLERLNNRQGQGQGPRGGQNRPKRMNN
ncbi:MAG: hypothetical protein HWE22_17525 [Flavobacteriales bacterium]|nr:hypothetical protein [Flavobacteriales bacterium]